MIYIYHISYTRTHAACGMWDLNSQSRDRTYFPCSEKRRVTTAGPPEVPVCVFISVCSKKGSWKVSFSGTLYVWTCAYFTFTFPDAFAQDRILVWKFFSFWIFGTLSPCLLTSSVMRNPELFWFPILCGVLFCSLLLSLEKYRTFTFSPVWKFINDFPLIIIFFTLTFKVSLEKVKH